MPNAPRAHKPHGPRKSAAGRGYDAKWKRFANYFIEMEMRAGRHCCACGCGKILLGRERREIHVDHKEPHRGQNDPRFWDLNNLQLMLAACHSRKTATRDGGFGH